MTLTIPYNFSIIYYYCDCRCFSCIGDPRGEAKGEQSFGVGRNGRAG